MHFLFTILFIVQLLFGTMNITHGMMRNVTFSSVPDEQRLLDKLFINYDKNVRPILNSNDSVKVVLGFTLIQITDMVSVAATDIHFMKRLQFELTFITLYSVLE